MQSTKFSTKNKVIVQKNSDTRKDTAIHCVERIPYAIILYKLLFVRCTYSLERTAFISRKPAFLKTRKKELLKS